MAGTGSRTFLKKSLRDWLIFSVGLIGIVCDAVYSQLLELPPVSFPVLFIANLAAAVMGGVGLPLAALRGNYARATSAPWTRRRLATWFAIAIVSNGTLSGLVGPLILSDKAKPGHDIWTIIASSTLPGILGAIPWIIVSGVLTAVVSAITYFVLRSIFLASDDVVVKHHLRGAAGLGALSFLAGSAILASFGTISWITGQVGSQQTPILELRRLLYNVAGVAVLAGILLHYLLWSLSARERRKLTKSVEVIVGGIAIMIVTTQIFYAIGIGSDTSSRLPYMLLLPQFINVFLASYYLTLSIAAGIKGRRRGNAG